MLVFRGRLSFFVTRHGRLEHLFVDKISYSIVAVVRSVRDCLLYIF